MATEAESNESCDIQEETTTFDPDEVTLRFPGMFQKTDVGMAVIFALFVVLTVSGNVLVLVVIKVTSSMRSPTHLFMGNLAVSYIVTGILVLPFSALIQFGGEWKFGHALCRIWVFLDKLCCGATVLSLCAISVDRYIGVSRPLAHGRIMSRSRTQWAIAFIWLISLAMSLGLLVGLEEKPAKINFCSVTIDSRYIIIRGIVNILIPSIVLLVLYWKVYRKAVSALRQGQDESDCESLRINRGETSTTSKELILVPMLKPTQECMIKEVRDEELMSTLTAPGHDNGTVVDASGHAIGIYVLDSGITLCTSFIGQISDVPCLEDNWKVVIYNGHDCKINGKPVLIMCCRSYLQIVAKANGDMVCRSDNKCSKQQASTLLKMLHYHHWGVSILFQMIQLWEDLKTHLVPLYLMNHLLDKLDGLDNLLAFGFEHFFGSSVLIGAKKRVYLGECLSIPHACFIDTKEHVMNNSLLLKKPGKLCEEFESHEHEQNWKLPYRCSLMPGCGALVGKVSVNEKLGMLQLENQFGKVFITLVIRDHVDALSHGSPFVSGCFCWLSDYKLVKEEFEGCSSQVYILCSPMSLRSLVLNANPSVESSDIWLHQRVFVRGKSLPFSYPGSDPGPKGRYSFLMDCLLIGGSYDHQSARDDCGDNADGNGSQIPRLLVLWGDATRYYPFIQVGCRYKLSVPLCKDTMLFQRETHLKRVAERVVVVPDGVMILPLSSKRLQAATHTVAECLNTENECPERVNVEGIIQNVHHFYEEPLYKKHILKEHKIRLHLCDLENSAQFICVYLTPNKYSCAGLIDNVRVLFIDIPVKSSNGRRYLHAAGRFSYQITRFLSCEMDLLTPAEGGLRENNRVVFSGQIAKLLFMEVEVKCCMCLSPVKKGRCTKAPQCMYVPADACLFMKLLALIRGEDVKTGALMKFQGEQLVCKVLGISSVEKNALQELFLEPREPRLALHWDVDQKKFLHVVTPSTAEMQTILDILYGYLEQCGDRIWKFKGFCDGCQPLSSIFTWGNQEYLTDDLIDELESETVMVLTCEDLELI
ncbi:unnamed protein product [Darwinula stevensoni]|uniref:G-protein coupled receptors family 1 profile domain-containing protein n=1 Tax=Darwinula stevensoni TaxID=69355 RepID=A0A7R8XM70_9CRUS|nr:unnamed protein product [Darwinula stevensoni]CAG0895214.1 unnamed protein product [Darwinula stevensoni]